jgi:hypothetical protein
MNSQPIEEKRGFAGDIATRARETSQFILGSNPGNTIS